MNIKHSLLHERLGLYIAHNFSYDKNRSILNAVSPKTLNMSVYAIT